MTPTHRAFAAATIILLAIGAFVVSAAVRFRQDLGWVEHTHLVIATLDRVDVLQERVMTAARGVVIFNRPADYADHLQADGDLQKELDVLVDLVADNPVQESRAVVLRSAMLDRLKYPRRAVARFRALGADGLKGVDVRQSDRAQVQTLEMLHRLCAEEQGLLRVREHEAVRASWLLALAGMLGIPVGLGVLWHAHLNLRRENLQRRQAEQRLDEANTSLLNMSDILREEAIRDPLTGLYNRRYLEDGMTREIARCERRQLPLAVLVMDIDHFRQFNTQYGHAGGDLVLDAVANLLKTRSRTEDIACRLGGEEFALVMPEAPPQVAIERAEKIREAIQALEIDQDGAVFEAVTVSIGVATMPADGTTCDELVRSADVRLYRAKNAGRNRVCADELAKAASAG